MTKHTNGDGRRNNRPPRDHQFKPGESGNPLGRPKKARSTFESEIKAVFGQEREVTIDGQPRLATMRELILEQVARGAVKGDTRMIKMCIPFLKIMDDAPEFEVLPEDKQIIQEFMKRFTNEGDVNDEDQ